MGCQGKCLISIKKNEFRSNGECAENCQPVRCANWDICGIAVPEHKIKEYDPFGRYLSSGICESCYDKFHSVLIINEYPEEECCVCYSEGEKTIRMPNCIHELCVDCFRKIHEFTNSFNWPRVFYKGETKLATWSDSDSDSDSEGNWYNKCPICREPT